MRFKKRLISSVIFSVAVLVASFILPIVPCRTAPAVPNPIYKWTLCSHNQDILNGLNSIKEYFGYTTSITDSYFILLILSFAAAMIFFHYATSRKKE